MHSPDIDLYAIRHLQSVANTEPHIVGGRSNHSPLAEGADKEGFLTAEALVEADLIPDFVTSSPAVRTVVSSDVILTAMGSDLRPIIYDDLQELDQGDWTGRLKSEIYSPDVRIAMEEQDKDFKAQGGESMNEVGSRMLGWAMSLSGLELPAVTGRPVRIFAFTHGIAIKCLAAQVEGWSRQRVFETKTPNGSVSKFMLRDNKWLVGYIGRSASDPLS